MFDDILKQLFLELYSVNHLMYDLISELEDTETGDEFLVGFYTRNITEDFSREEIEVHSEEYSASCLNSLSSEEKEEFLEELFEL